MSSFFLFVSGMGIRLLRRSLGLCVLGLAMEHWDIGLRRMGAMIWNLSTGGSIRTTGVVGQGAGALFWA